MKKVKIVVLVYLIYSFIGMFLGEVKVIETPKGFYWEKGFPLGIKACRGSKEVFDYLD